MNEMDTRFANQFNIQWFPGHMTKTLRMMEQEIQHVDASLVLLDARIPLSSLNPEIERITARKPKLYALNKADLADPAVTEEWIRYFRAADAGCVAISAKQKGGANAVKTAIEKELAGLLERRQNRGMGGAKTQVMLCGIPNVGKSTLMNLISKSEVFAENKLFATLDTTVRKVVFDNLPFLLSDTVGFIRKLPTELIESFKSTLDEVREADLLVHVVDISHPQFEEQIDVVKQTLQDIGAGDKPVYLVFNKVDAYTYVKKDEDDLTPATRENLSLDDLKKSWIARTNTPCIFLSARMKTNVEKFRTDLYGMVREIHAGRYPFNNFLY